VVTGVVASVVIWVAPLIELWRGRPDNLHLLWDFFTAPHTTPTLHEAFGVTALGATIIPFGYRDYIQTVSRNGVDLAVGGALLVVGLGLALGLGWHRRQRLSLALSATSVLGLLLGFASLALTAAPVLPYLAVWLAFVPAIVLVAIGVALCAPPAPGRGGARGVVRAAGPRPGSGAPRWIVATCVVAAIVAASLVVRSDLGMGPVRTTTVGAGPWPQPLAATLSGRRRSRQDVIALTAAAERVLRPGDRWVGFTIATPSLWPMVAGMVLELDERGVQSTVGPRPWELYFGHERAPGRPVQVAFELRAAGEPGAGADPGPGRAVIAEVDGEVLTAVRAPG